MTHDGAFFLRDEVKVQTFTRLFASSFACLSVFRVLLLAGCKTRR